MRVTRGFKGKQGESGSASDRVPPGQFVTQDFPVLTAGPTQQTLLESWSLALQNGEQLLAHWNWAQFEALPQTERTFDIHCVTKWTKLETRWRGVTLDDLIKAAGLTSTPHMYVMAHGDGGYTANLPVADLMDGKAMVATHFEATNLRSPAPAAAPNPVLGRLHLYGGRIESSFDVLRAER